MAPADNWLNRTDEAKHRSARWLRLVARPLSWLYAAVAGIVLAGIGVAIDAHRYEHGAATAALISRSNPGVLISLAGIGIATLGVLLALTLLAFEDASSADTVTRRWVGVLVAWTAIACAGAAGVTYVAASGLTIGRSGRASTGASAARPVTTNKTAPTEVPGVRQRVTLHGGLTVDGRPLQADFLGARVIRDRLVSACQQDIPRVADGRYEIGVMADAEARGCGAPGAQILLWTYIGGHFLYSRETMPWPGDGATPTFDASFSTVAPDGAASSVTAFKGHVVRRDGTRLGGGTVVEAFVGDTRCGVATVRRDAEAWFTLLVAGPQVAGCAKDGRITFRADGEPSTETATNDLGGDSTGLTIQITID